MGQKEQPQQTGAGNKSNYMKVYEHFGDKQAFSNNLNNKEKKKNQVIENKNKVLYIDTIILIILFYILGSPETFKFTKKLGLNSFRKQLCLHSLIFGLLYFVKIKYYD